MVEVEASSAALSNLQEWTNPIEAKARPQNSVAKLYNHIAIKDFNLYLAFRLFRSPYLRQTIYFHNGLPSIPVNLCFHLASISSLKINHRPDAAHPFKGNITDESYVSTRHLLNI
jgi:hypothetical protein